MDVHPGGIEVLHVLEHPAPLLAQLHNVAHIVVGGQDVRVGDRLLRLGDGAGIGVVGGVVNQEHRAVGQGDAVDDARRGGNQVKVVFPLQPFLDDLHMQQPQEAAAEPEAEGHRGFGLIGQGRVVELEAFKRLPQVLVMRAVGGEDAAEHHGVDLAVAGQRLRRRAGGQGNGVAHPRVPHRLDRSGEVADLPGSEPLVRLQPAGAHDAGFDHVEFGAGGHHPDPVARLDLAGHDPEIDDDAFVAVVVAVKDQGAQGGIVLPGGGRDLMDDRLKYRVNIDPLLGGDRRRFGGVNADDVLDLLAHLLRPGGGQVDLVDDRHDLQPVVDRQIGVGQRLRLNPLGGVDHQDRPFARGQGAGDLVVEVHMTGGVDQVEQVVLPVLCPVGHRDGVGFDGDAALPLKVHAVKQLVLHVALGDGLGFFQQAVGQGGFPVVNMGDNAKIPDMAAGYVQSKHLVILRGRTGPAQRLRGLWQTQIMYGN